MTKRCTKCQRDLPLGEFGSACKSCNRTRMRSYGRRPEVMARRSEYNRAYRAKNADALSAANREYRHRNADRIRLRRMAYYLANRERIVAYIRAYNRKNRVLINAKMRAYYASHRDEAAARTKNWRAKNRDRHLEHCRRRTRLKQAAGQDRLTAAQWETIKRAFCFRCAYCGRKPKVLTQDHVIPLGRGGLHTAENVVPACGRCNSKKWANPAPTVHVRTR